MKTKAIISAMTKSLMDEANSLTDWDSNQANEVSYKLAKDGLVLAVAGFAISILSFASIVGAAAELLAIAGWAISLTSAEVADAGYLLASDSLSSTYISTKKDLLASLVSMQQTFSIGKGSNEEEVKILRYRYRFYEKEGAHYIDWSPFYLSSDYNFYNDENVSFQINHSGIDGTVRGIKNQEEIEQLIKK